LKYYFIAGEPSGDLHAGNCMKEIIAIDGDAKFAFTGGDLMQEITGRQADIHITKMAFMGFVEVVKNFSAIKENFKKVKQSILEFKPDVLVLVDYPGFNLRMAKWATEKNIKVHYYISPTVWAWKESRVEKIKKYTNKLFVILPFEEAFYKKHNHKVYFVGHPLMDAIEQKKQNLLSKEDFFRQNNLEELPLVAVLPGSRAQEVNRMTDIMLDVVPQFKTYKFVVAGTNNLPKTYYYKIIDQGIKVVFNQTYELLQYAQAGIIKSGTSTLESALFKLPQVICYKGGNVSYQIAKKLIRVKYIGLPNLIMDAPIVKELIQNELTVENISDELNELLFNKNYRDTMIHNYNLLAKKLGGGGASKRVAEMIVNDIKKSDA
jgi:lipid-A-disaccharide synthase